MSGRYLDGDDVRLAVGDALGDTVGISSGLTASDTNGDGIGLAMGDAVGYTVGLSEEMIFDKRWAMSSEPLSDSRSG